MDGLNEINFNLITSCILLLLYFKNSWCCLFLENMLSHGEQNFYLVNRDTHLIIIVYKTYICTA